MRGQKKKKEKHQNCRGPSQSWAWSIGPRDKAQSMGLGFPFPPFYLLRCTHSLSDSIHSSSSHSSLASMALLAVHAMAASPATFPSSHHHAAVSSYCALPATAAFSRSRSRVAAAAAATLSAPLTPVLEGNWHAYLTSLSLFCSSIRISLVWNWLDDLIWNCFSNRIARIQLIQHQNIDWNKNLVVWTNYDSNSNYSIWCDQFTAGEGTRRPRGEKGSTTRTEMWASSTKIKLIKNHMLIASCASVCCNSSDLPSADCCLLISGEAAQQEEGNWPCTAVRAACASEEGPVRRRRGHPDRHRRWHPGIGCLNFPPWIMVYLELTFCLVCTKHCFLKLITVHYMVSFYIM